MPNISKKHNVQLILSSGQFRGRRMTLCIRCDNRCVIDFGETESDMIKFDFFADIPLVLDFVVGAKDKYDTEIDETGQIIADKFIRLDVS